MSISALKDVREKRSRVRTCAGRPAKKKKWSAVRWTRRRRDGADLAGKANSSRGLLSKASRTCGSLFPAQAAHASNTAPELGWYTFDPAVVLQWARLPKIREKAQTDIAPITENDAAIAAAIEQAHLPSLIASLVHITGDESLVTGEIKPVYDFFGDGQGALTPEQMASTKAKALAALRDLRDGKAKVAPLSTGTVHKIMSFVAGAPIPERYIAFLEEELALDDKDHKKVHGLDTIPAGKKQDFKALIIGAGMSGLLAAIRMKHAGIDYIVVEKNADVGGTWMVNSYPGCRVDNPNHLYSYSFEPNHDWPYHFSTQPLLWKYFQGVADNTGCATSSSRLK